MNIKNDNPSPDVDVKLNKVVLVPANVNLKLGDSQIIQVRFDPENYPKKTGRWSYDGAYIERITETNAVLSFTAIQEGTTQITYIPDDDATLTASCNVNIGDVVLEKIELSPQNEISSYGKQFDIDVKYIPNEAKHLGNWLYDPTVLKLYPISTDKGRFEVISTVPQTTKITFSNGDIQDENMCTILNQPATEIVLSPDKETISLGDSFYIDIDYTPVNADKIGVWSYDNTKVRLLDDTDQYTRAHFVSIDETSDVGTELTFMSGYVGASNTCYISKKLDSLSFDPASETVKLGDTFKVTVLYDPPSVIHQGKWDYDMQYLRMITDSNNMEYAEFLVVSDSIDPTKITFTSYDKLAINVCTISNKDKLQGIQLNPSSETVKLGDVFKIGITYVPDTADHNGVWEYDKDVFGLSSGSTPDEATFTVLKDSDTPLTLTYSSGSISASNTCTIIKDDPTPVVDKVTLDPEVYTAPSVGHTFIIKVMFDPDDASHDGEWTYDSEYLVRQDVRIGKDVAVFRTLKPTNDTVTTVVFTSTNNKSDSCSIVINDEPSKF